ncbi:hypothetical protein ANN_08759 [Periplaneta americana]|uniref:Reverse transcriptase domain-containing protein n=1 Tax=Periplaneta americana TaxID=6978 RepID=A0ABQ8T3U0_PERAM|nr:hypothetical protein ANN_08759 [Periplaneta americana]
MSPGPSTNSYPAFAHTGFRENPGNIPQPGNLPRPGIQPVPPGFTARRGSHYSTELLYLPNAKHDNPKEMRMLINQLCRNLNAIEALKIDTSLHDMLLSHFVLQRVILRRFINSLDYLASQCDDAGEMSPGSSTEGYTAFAHIGLRENPGKNLNQISKFEIIIEVAGTESKVDKSTSEEECLQTEAGNSTNKEAYAPELIIIIHKPGKPVSNRISYRLISLLSTISKVFGKVFAETFGYVSTSILPPYQFGFRRNHSTNHQVLRITEQIAQGFEKKEQPEVAFLDFTQAFDRVWHKDLRCKLHKYSVPDYLRNIMTSFLSNRTFSVKVSCTHSSVRSISAGVPQGSILASILFNVYTSDIPATPTAQIATYADDTALYAMHRNINVTSNHLQEALNIICSWLENWRIALNYNKCKAMIYTLCCPANSPCINLSTNVIRWKPKDEAVK